MKSTWQKYAMLVVVASFIAIAVARVGFGDPWLLVRVLVVVCGVIGGAQSILHALSHGWRANVPALLRGAAGFFLSAAAVPPRLNVYFAAAAAMCMLSAVALQRRQTV
jgi:hypothetical protein